MEIICNKLQAYLKADNSIGMGGVTDTLIEMCMDLSDGIRSVKSEFEKNILIKEYLKKVIELNASSKRKTPDFKAGLDWLNVTEPLSLYKHLNGKLVLLDFFTYCCINCMHILPELKKLEKEFPVEEGLVVIGVHNAKFENEKITSNIESAVRRYEVSHPVVNDVMVGMWTALGVNCWPTQIILGPSGEPLLIVRGEGHFETMRLFIKKAIETFKEKNKLSLNNIPSISAFKSPVSSSFLYYPGKVCVSLDEDLLAISDTAHHRVILSSLTGQIKDVIGGTEGGFADGDFSGARFSSPQGLTFIDQDTLLVADTENHSIRKIDFRKRCVTTIVGNGKQGHDYTGGKIGMNQEISSPWDVCYVECLNTVFIAVAGTHQIWAYFLKDTTLWRIDYKAETCWSVVGSGKEENRNSSYPKRAGLSQPSGLSYNSEANVIYFADSESSTVRKVDLEDGSTSLLAGGALSPLDLFAYGDVDGLKIQAKLQHPLDVAWHKKGLFIADSYNHKIKQIDPETRYCNTIGYSNYYLDEPGGLCCSKNKLFIADTNNHAVKVMDLTNYFTDTIEFKWESPQVLNVIEKYHIKTKGDVKINVSVSLSEGVSVNNSAPSCWTLYYPEYKLYDQRENSILEQTWTIKCLEKENSVAVIKGRLFLCDGDLCTVKEFAFQVIPSIDDSAPTSVDLNIEHKIK